jgi:hypothetical protein
VKAGPSEGKKKMYSEARILRGIYGTVKENGIWS